MIALQEDARKSGLRARIERDVSWPLAALLALVGTASLPTNANADIFFFPPFPGGGGGLNIGKEIVFTINVAATAQYLVLDDWVSAYDGTVTTVASSTPLLYSINDGTNQTGPSNVALTDNGLVFGDITERDGVLQFSDLVGQISVQPGDTFILKPRGYSFPPAYPFAGMTRGISGNVFLADQNGVRISNIVQAPEPNSALLVLGASTVFIGYFRRKRKIPV